MAGRCVRVVTAWGIFFVDRRERVGDLWTYTCYDKLIFGDVPYVSSLTYPATMKAVWDEICGRLDYTYDSSVQINASYRIPVAPTGYSMRQVLMHICSAHAACAYMDKAGTLKWRSIKATEKPVFEMSPSDYIRIKQTNPVKSYSRVVVTYDEEDKLTYEAGTGPDSQTMFVICPYATQQITDNILAAIDGYSYQPVSITPRGFPQLDQGDRLQLEVFSSVPWENASISWQDAHFPWDGLSTHETLILHQELRYKGGFSMQVEAPSISEQQSEFVVEGTLTGQVNRLAQNSVRFGKPYYGVTHSKERGIVVDRSDGLADMTLNADELRFRADGQDALWFDIPSRRFKFSGTLEAADGVFSGTIRAGKIIGGTIEGTNISASVITGNTINGGSINGTIISGAAIYGGVITGPLIQTGESYPRIRLNSSGRLLEAESSSSNALVISPNESGVPALYFKSDGNVGTYIQHVSGTGLLISVFQGSATISPGREINLSPGGGFDIRVPAWSRFYGLSNGRSLQQELDSIYAAIAAVRN